jgi:uncharacterized protein HemX
MQLAIGQTWYSKYYGYKKPVIIKSLFDGMVAYFIPAQNGLEKDEYNVRSIISFTEMYSSNFEDLEIKQLTNSIKSKEEHIQHLNKQLNTERRKLSALIEKNGG